MEDSWVEMDDEQALATESIRLRPPAAPPKGDPFLIVLNDGAIVPKVIRLSSASTMVGRGKTAELRFSDGGVSGTHCELKLGSDRQVTLRDLSSTNGTYVNGEAIREQVLNDGDRIRIGHRVALLLAYQEGLNTRYSTAVQELASRDPLNRVFSQRVLIDQLRMEFIYSKRSKEPLSLCVADVDGLEVLNQKHGRGAGDAALVAVTQAIQAQLRSNDFVVRYGGEEFGVVMRACDTRLAVSIGEKIRNAVEKLSTPVLGSGHEMASISTTLCAGIATLTRDEYQHPDQLFQAAEASLQSAKRMGRNRVMTALRSLEAP